MKFPIAICLGVLFLYHSPAAVAQSFTTPPASISFQNFTHEDGLNDNYITHIYQDSRGFIWISTREGLNRFDGTGFKKFDGGNDNRYSFASTRITIVFEYQANRLLIATDKGLVTMNTIDQQLESTGDKMLDSSTVLEVAAESRNRIWLASIDGLILADSSLRVQKVLNLLEAYKGVRAMHKLNDGRMILTTRLGYYFLNTNSGALTPVEQEVKGIGFINDPIISHYDTRTGLFYCYQWGKPVLRVDFAKKNVTRLTDVGAVHSLRRDSRGNTWIGTLTGLILYNESTGRTVRYNHYPDQRTSLIHDVILFLYEDREKNLWIGTNEGLSKLSSRALTLTSYNRELTIDSFRADIYDVIKGNDEKIYIATFGNGVFSIDSMGRTRNFGKDLIPYAWSLRKEGNKMIVTGHQKRIYELDMVSGKTRVMPILKPFSDSGNLVTFSYKDRQGGEWYSINQQVGLFHKKANEKHFTRHWSKSNPAPFMHSYFSMATEDNRHRIWFGMNKRSDFISYDLNTGRFKRHELGQSVGINLAGVNCLLADENRVWIGTNGSGLIHYNPEAGTARVYKIEDGLSSNDITSLVYDKAHRLWVGSSRGLSCLLSGEQRFLNFSQADGFPEINFGEGAMYYDSANNRLYAGAKATLICFNPDDFLKSTVPHKPLYLDEIRVNGERIAFSSLDELKLPYNRNNLQFSFTIIDFENPHNIHYAYMLEGADNDWIESGSQRTVSYNNLQHGNYRFLIKAMQPGNSQVVQTKIPFTISILPPYWKTLWFRGIVIVFIVGLIYALVRIYYLRKLERQRLGFEKQKAIEQERTRIATDMHDDLGAGLSRIRFLSEALSNKKTADETLRSGLEKISGYSDEMTEKMGEIVWTLNEKNDTLADLVAYTRAYTMEYLGNHGLACEMNTPLQLPRTFIAGDTRRNIFLAVKESLHNIIKHADATKVYFSIQLTRGIEIIIHDNGKGIDWDKQRSFSNGLQNIQKRMMDIKGKAEFRVENGTKVILQAPWPL